MTVTPVEFPRYLKWFVGPYGVGVHSQFRHVNQPPEEFVFVETSSWRNPAAATGLRRMTALLLKFFRQPALLRASFRAVCGAVAYAREALRLGVSWPRILRFLKSRSPLCQLKIPGTAKLAFLPTYPAYIGTTPWMLEIEDSTTLFFPYVRNGDVKSLSDVARLPREEVRVLLRLPACRAIITHVRSTVESVHRLFGDDVIDKKVSYIPMGVDVPKLPASRAQSRLSGDFHMIFTSSWNQESRGFYLRGGMDILATFHALSERHPELRLTIRATIPPDLPQEMRRILDNPRIQVIDHFVSREELWSLIDHADLYLLPSARLHVVSILEIMARATPLLVSDGWGFDEYVRHGETGWVVKGRYGKASWLDSGTGALVENYDVLRDVNSEVVAQMTDLIESALADRRQLPAMGARARQAVIETFSIARWNEQLRRVFSAASR
jgi:glycosyltransferase involved in cell wall biosynthesis